MGDRHDGSVVIRVYFNMKRGSANHDNFANLLFQFSLTRLSCYHKRKIEGIARNLNPRQRFFCRLDRLLHVFFCMHRHHERGFELAAW